MIAPYIPGVVDYRTEAVSVEAKAVAFIDILGFSSLSKSLLSDLHQANALDYLLSFAERLLNGSLGVAKDTDVRMFSDCISVTCPSDPRHLVRLVYSLQALQLNLVNSGIFVRGGVSIGRHFQTPRMILSEALIDAYKLEASVAIFPRIVVDNSVIEVLSTVPKAEWEGVWDSPRRPVEQSLDVHIASDSFDGVPFINYLAYLDWVDSGPLHRDYIYEHAIAISQWIKGAGEINANTSVREKQRWVIQYHNSCVQKLSHNYPHYIEFMINETKL